MGTPLQDFKAGIFQALGHPTRIAIVEALQNGELTAGAILEKVSGQQASISQHLSVLRSKGVVVSRKEGNQVFYTLRDEAISSVLAIMKTYFEAQLREAADLLQEIETP
ncbi:MAG: transcriptional regulator [Phycisphaerae bacterium]|nr:MAG: transcriptional regulator [Phycisphaerae bacterium]